MGAVCTYPILRSEFLSCLHSWLLYLLCPALFFSFFFLSHSVWKNVFCIILALPHFSLPNYCLLLNEVNKYLRLKMCLLLFAVESMLFRGYAGWF